ncbi:hypothetical protein CW148_14050 [Salmonella enterica subsp. enterica serovar Muenster]|nr:hypothetical protein [Salmonella enterica]ECH8849861.1 hypothetical protein [Salmonella enterica subsp. enterica]ECT2890073.1 hypothetical protein [Salmonella enterica subsp. enterica serovar Muenster]EEH0132801.1 hypothetical protein [Salmonella enterica subsp. enterica serovar Liverpool]EGH0573567.1 hypothetical protein [Salmonella enterica subsp. enterica serovar Uganda]EIQ4887598.1 hypothetical protein [Salmonella enterica subsp. enterica serovar Senftenberg]
MKSHDRLRIVFAQARQNWRAFAYVMQVHENHYTKRAGVAGIRARAAWKNGGSKSQFAKGLVLLSEDHSYMMSKNDQERLGQWV